MTYRLIQFRLPFRRYQLSPGGTYHAGTRRQGGRCAFMRDPAHLIPLAGHCALTMRHSTSPLAQRLEQTVHGAELRLGGRDGGENDGVSLEMIE